MNPWILLRRPVFFAVAVNLLVIAWPDTSAAQVLAPDDVVLWTAAASPDDVHGDWVREVDGTAAGGVHLRNPDRGRLKMTTALASPVNYFEMSFTARRATPYHMWIRMQARNDSTRNDSVHVQFSDSVDVIGQSLARIGTTSSAEMVLQNGPSGSPLGWGWTDNGWGVLGEPIYFEADGTHVIRIQQREDGTVIDQIVLSPVTFATAAPGAPLADTKILPRALGIGPSVSAATSVIRAASAAAGRMFGTWQTISDATAAGSQALRNPDAGTAMIAPALSNPASYFEATFSADAGRPYHVWVRMKTDGDSLSNDSVHLQFSDSVTSGSAPTARIGTSSSFEVVLQDGPNGPAPHGWGWTDNGSGALGTHVYFAATGTHTLRVQQREDGAVIDQIVISPDTFLTTPAGWRLDDVTILQASAPPPPENLPPIVTLTAPVNGASYTAPATITLAATASDPENRLSKVEFYNGLTLLGSDASAPFGWTWSGVAAGSYQLRAVAVDAGGASTGSATVTVGVTAPSSNQPPLVTLTAPANGATFTAPATIALSATASDPENRLARVEFYNGSALLGTDTSAPFSFTWSSVGAGSYQLKSVAVDADGGSATSASAAVTVAAASPAAFPTGWQHQDVGAPAIAGSASFNNGTYTVTGAGTNVWNVSDEFHFVYQQVTGDVDIIARVASLQGSNEWSKAGVMVRESLADNARHGLAHFTLGNGSRYTWRTVTGGTTGDSGGCAPGTTGWVRLTRTGSSLQRRYSADGQTWSSCATVTISMAPAVYVGLVVSNVDATQRATAVFDNVSVTTPGGTTNQPPTVTLTTNGSTFTAPATITLSATASDPENRLSKVDFYSGTTLLATDTSSPYSFTWSSVPAGNYSLRAVATDADGGSASATATVTVGTSTPGPTRQVVFTASVDHAIVTNYLLEVFPSTANTATATAIASSDLGKPTPSGTNEITVDRTTFLNNLAPGSYLITVASVGTGGKSRSAAISFTR